MSATRAAAAVAVLAALAGGFGVALAAVAAHKVQVPALTSAANMLMVHGAAGIGLLAFGAAGGRLWLAAAALVVLGSIVFASAVSLPILTGSSAFGGLAPIGGSTVMIGWAVAAFAAARQLFDAGA